MNVIHAIILLIPLYVQASSAYCEMYRFDVTNHEQAMEDHVIKTVTKPFVSLCWSDCVWLPWCLSINVRQTSDGMFECELNNSSKKAHPSKMASRKGWNYQEMEETDGINCGACECKIKKDLGDDWYRYGNSKIKLFIEKKNWTDARSHCQSLGGDLLSITSSHENDFVNDVFVENLNLTYAQEDLPWPGIYWKMNGAEPEIKLDGTAGNAKYILDGKENALFLNGHYAFARFPGITLDREGFSMAVWLKPSNNTRKFIPAIGIFNNGGFIKFLDQHLEKRMSITIKETSILQITYPEQNQWWHFAITWDNTTSTLKYYFQGIKAKTAHRPDLSPIVVKSDYEFIAGSNGAPKFLESFHGSLKHVMVANKTLEDVDIQTAMHWNEQGPWIALYSPSNSPTFRWSDGTSNTTLNLFPNYTPEPLLSDRKCAILIEKKWLDKHCYLKNPYICKVPGRF